MSAVVMSDVATGRLTPDFDRIFREHYELVYCTAYAVTGSPEDAEDVLQTIFLRLLRREFPPDLQQSPKAYFYRAAVNLSLNTIRLRKRHVPTVNEDRFEATAPDSEADALEELHTRLYDAIAELDSDAAQMLILRY